MPPLDFDEVCRLVGRLYLESQALRNEARQSVSALEDRVRALEKERDELLRTLGKEGT